MNIYMAYSAAAGPAEGAVLVFADTARQAKALAFKGSYLGDLCDNEWTDVRARLIRGCDWLWREKQKDEPHVIEAPRSCESCLMWGGSSEIGDDGLCDDCREDGE